MSAISWKLYCTVLLGLLLPSSHTSEARAIYGNGKSSESQTESFAFLELALRRVLSEISCEELTAEELETQFRTNSTVTRNVRAILKHIDLPTRSYDGAGSGDGDSSEKLHFLDYRLGVSDTDCMAGALPRLRVIESAVPVFPAYYMEWECGEGCMASSEDVTNYELLRKTGTCCDGTADWTTFEAGCTHPLNVVRTCSAVNKRV